VFKKEIYMWFFLGGGGGVFGQVFIAKPVIIITKTGCRQDLKNECLLLPVKGK
jgi:hypothetical protein